MKRPLYILPVLFTCLLACGKKEQVKPSETVEASIGQPTSLAYQQSGQWAIQGQDPLRVNVYDIQDSRCPKNSRCYTAGNARVVLQITGGGLQEQLAPLCLGCPVPETDTLRLRTPAGGYLIVLQQVTPEPVDARPAKKDQRVTLLVQQR